MFIRVYRPGGTVSHVGNFDPALGTVAPLTLSLVQLSSLHTSLCQSTAYTDSVWLGEGGEALSPVGDHILLEFNTLYLTKFRTYKIARPPPQTKT
jgi:hypothetical protein